jgi:hypothetical protein
LCVAFDFQIELFVGGGVEGENNQRRATRTCHEVMRLNVTHDGMLTHFISELRAALTFCTFAGVHLNHLISSQVDIYTID